MRGGKLDLYALLLADGRITRVTDSPAFSRGADPVVSRNSDRDYYRDGLAVRCVDGATLVDREIAAVPAGWEVYQWLVDRDERYLSTRPRRPRPPA